MFRLDISSFGVVAFAMPFLLVDAAKRRVAFFKETSHWCVEFRYLLKKKTRRSHWALTRTTVYLGRISTAAMKEIDRRRNETIPVSIKNDRAPRLRLECLLQGSFEGGK